MTVPALQLALPGTWAQVPLDDEVRVDRVVELAGQAGTGVAARETLRAVLQQLAATGGDQLYLRQDPSVPTVLLTAWQPAPAGADAGPGALRDALGLPAEAAALPRSDGAVALRAPRSVPGCASAATYWVAVAGARHVLALTVLLLGDAVDPEEPAFYDRLAGSLTWQEGERRASA